MKKESVKYHKESVNHKRATETKAAVFKKSSQIQTPIEKSLMKLDEGQTEKMEKLFRTAYYIAANAKPFTDFVDLCKLQIENKVVLGDTYLNDKYCANFIEHIAGCQFDQLKVLLKNSPFISIYCDGSTDNANSEKEVILVKLLDDFYPKTMYFKLKEPPNTKSDGIVHAINEAFNEFDMPNYQQKTVGFCSDGASVMMGEKQGVIQKIKDLGQSPWILAIWCLAHRLELALKDTFKKEYMETVVEVLTSIFYFYKGSAKRNKEVAGIAELMESHFTKPERCNGTRWVDHKFRAISKLISNWKILVMHMMSYSEDNSNASQYRAKAKGILKKMMMFKFIWFLHFMKDLLKEIAKISLQFQRNDITLSSVLTKLQSANESLCYLSDNDGESLQNFWQNLENGNEYQGEKLSYVVAKESLFEEKKRLVCTVIDCIHSRLSNIDNDSLYLSCHVFDPKNWPNYQDRQALLLYGSDDIQVLFNHFQIPLTDAGFDLNSARGEWKDLKLYVSRNDHFRGKNPLNIWQRVSQEDIDREEYKNILLLIHMTNLYPLSNAACERAFSVMKRIKDDWRCSLGTDRLDQLMRITFNDKGLQNFQAGPAVKRWWLSGLRAKRPEVQPYGPRQSSLNTSDHSVD